MDGRVYPRIKSGDGQDAGKSQQCLADNQKYG